MLRTLLKALGIAVAVIGLVLLAWILARLSFEYYPGE